MQLFGDILHIMDKKIIIGIIGGSGLTGMELARILSLHKNVEIGFITSRKYDGKKVTDVFPSFNEYRKNDLVFIKKAGAESLKKIDLIFLCLPPLKSMEFLRDLPGGYDFKIIDIGSDFRIKDPQKYKYWYGEEHVLKEKLGDFIYGLAEINKNMIRGSSYVANPGCYPTSVLLGLAPVLRGKINIDHINIDSKSGVTGAGRKLKDMYLFSSLSSNFYSYSPDGHRHTGEIEQEIENLSGKKFKICFTPHLLPVDRGIFTSIYCKLPGSGKGSKKFLDHVHSLFKDFYTDSTFVRYMGSEVPQLKDAVGTNMCLIGAFMDERTNNLKIFSCIDNLLKGAAGAAVQNMNIMMGLDEEEGLTF